jgi:hypothetical protein
MDKVYFKKTVFLGIIFFIFLLPWPLFSSGGLEEKDIPDPEHQYVLPEEITGKFIIPSLLGNTDISLSVYKTNKYILELDSHHERSLYSYGYVIQDDGRYFFSPLEGKWYITEKTEIFFDTEGIYFIRTQLNMDPQYYYAIRKRPVIINEVSKEIEVPHRTPVKKEYFLVKQNNIEGIFPSNELLDSEFKGKVRPWHSLTIKEGHIHIYEHSQFESGIWVIWTGYINVIKKEDVTTGIIYFTNSLSYGYFENGIGEITITDGSIKIVLPCSRIYENKLKELIPDAESPIYWIFEF